MSIRHIGIVLGCAALLAAAIAPLVAAPPGSQSATAFRTAQDEDFPSFGVKLTGPHGWQRATEGSLDRIARWVKPDAAGRPTALLQVDHGRVGGTLEQESAAIAKSMAVSNVQSVRIDGEDAVWAQGAAAQNDVQVVVALRGKVKYVATLLRPKGPPGDTAADGDADVMKTFIDAWKWRDLEEPADHVTFMARPIVVLGTLHINLPSSARPDAVDSAQSQIHYTLMNLKTQDDEFHVRLNLREGPVPSIDALDAQLKDKLVPDARLVWAPAGDNAVLSRWARTGGPGKALWIAVGIARISDKQTAVVTFALDREEDDVQRTYADVARRITASIGPE